MAMLAENLSINLATMPSTTEISTRMTGDAFLKKEKNLFILFYLKKLSTNSYLLNT